MFAHEEYYLAWKQGGHSTVENLPQQSLSVPYNGKFTLLIPDILKVS